MPVHARKKEAEARRVEPVTAPPEQREDVRALSAVLAHVGHRAKGRSSGLSLEGRRGERAVVPRAVFSVLERAVKGLARGEAVTVISVAQELTTQEAANILNVSRQYLVRLLNEQAIPHTKTGKHRRLRLGDVLVYKRRRDAQRKKALTGLTRLSQELGLYDDLR